MKIVFKSLYIYYIVGAILITANFYPTLHISVGRNYGFHANLSEFMVNWFISCFVVSLPLLFECSVDYLVSVIYPVKSTIIEHQLGHLILILSLLWPFILVLVDKYDRLNILIGRCLISFCHGQAVCAVYGKLLFYDPKVWKLSNVLPTLTLFVASQCLLSRAKAFCDEEDDNEATCPRNVFSVGWALALGILTSCVHFYLTRKYMREIFGWLSNTMTTNSVDDSSNYRCLLMSSILSVYFMARNVLLALLLANPANEIYTLRVKIGVLMILVVVTAVVPGRIVRRRLLNMKNEMEHNKTFVRYISHEIRSPLSTTSLGLDYLLERMPSGAIEYKDVLDVIRDAKVTCEIATCTLNDLLMFDKMETGMLDVTPVECNARDFVTNCAKTFKLQASGGDVTLSCLTDDFPDDLDFNCESNIGVKIDKYKMEQVLRNFLSNALKFTPRQGKVEIRMSIVDSTESYVEPSHSTKSEAISTRMMSVSSRNWSVSTRNWSPSVGSWSSSTRRMYSLKRSSPIHQSVPNRFRVEVVDNGPGISPENLPKLFGQYVQFDANTLQGGKGSGLGLWLSKAIVEMHGGVIGATSEGLGHGCTFYFELPCYVLRPTTAERFAASATLNLTTILSRTTSSEDVSQLVLDRNVSVLTSLKKPSPDEVLEVATATGPLSVEISTSMHRITTNDAALTPSMHRGGANRKTPGARKRGDSNGSELSIRRYDSNGDSVRSKSSKHSGNASQVSMLKILLVDDSALARKMVDRSLVGMYRLCHHAANGQEAVHMVVKSMSGTDDIETQSADPYDVVLMDYYMPVMSGPEATKRLRELGYKGIILAVTGNSCTEEQTEMLNCGVDRVLVKPFNIDIFRAMINELLLHRKSDSLKQKYNHRLTI